jgi:hypothetical protein
MSILYQSLAKAIALRVNQLADAVSSDVFEDEYSSNPLVDIMDGLELPHTALRQAIIDAEAEIVAMIGNSSNVQLRSALQADSPVLVMEADYPVDIPVNSTKGKFFGKFDGLYNAITHLPLQMLEKQVVLRRIRNAGGFYKLKHDCYFIEGSKVFFACSTSKTGCSCSTTASCTCTGKSEAYFRGVGWSRNVAESAYDSESKSVLPDQLANLWIALVLASVAQENFFMAQAGWYNNKALQSARAVGLEYVPEDMPDSVNTNTENQNAASENR